MKYYIKMYESYAIMVPKEDKPVAPMCVEIVPNAVDLNTIASLEFADKETVPFATLDELTQNRF